MPFLKFRYSETATKKFEKKPFVLMLISNFKKKWEIVSNFVVFLQYLNFKSIFFLSFRHINNQSKFKNTAFLLVIIQIWREKRTFIKTRHFFSTTCLNSWKFGILFRENIPWALYMNIIWRIFLFIFLQLRCYFCGENSPCPPCSTSSPCH